MRKRAVKFITVFFLSLVLVVACPLLGIRSEAADLSFFNFPTEVNVSYTYGDVGIDTCVTASFPSYVQNQSQGGVYGFYLYCNPVYTPSLESDDLYYIDNVRMVINGETFPASYQSPGNYFIQGQFEMRYTTSHCSILVDVHRIAKSKTTFSNVAWSSSGSAVPRLQLRPTSSLKIPDLYFNVLLNSKSGGGYSGYSKMDSKYILKDDLPSYEITQENTYLPFTSSTTGGFSTENNAATLSGGTVSLNMGAIDIKFLSYATEDLIQQQTVQQHTDSLVEQSLLQQLYNQQHSDAQNQLDESKKQTDAMTKFDGKSDMDKNSSDLNGSLSGYDEAQQSIFASSTVSIEKFDIDNLFTFTANISAALLVWNNLMVSIVASMGDFSLIYTISMGLVFIGIVVGIWRFFVK